MNQHLDIQRTMSPMQADSDRDTDLLSLNVFEMFWRQAELHPDAVAIVGAVAVTYRDLAERASAIAENLSRRGLPDQATVGVLMHRDPQLVATLLGVFKAGFAYVPLDPEDPPERASLMLTGSRCSLVIGNADLLARIGAILDDTNDRNRTDTSSERRGPELVDVNRIGVRSAQAIAAPPTCAKGGDRLAYVLFTSGSTGQPKGIEVEHRNVANLLVAARDLLNFTAADRYLAVSTVGFDISVAELFLPLITGGSLLLRDRRLLMQPTRMADEIARHNVTVVQTGPSVWSTILDAVDEFPHVRVAITTGEAVAPATAERLRSVADHVWNLYGPTETTVWATAYEVSNASANSTTTSTSNSTTIASTVSAPIGTPLANISAMVVDASGREVDDRESGELWLSGLALARGYCGNPQLTRERFVVTETGQRWYRTGDLVARDGEGVIHYYGRNDDQIKVRGVRIEPMEVESALLSTPGVDQAAATWFDSGGESRSLIAAIVRSPGTTVSSQELHEHVAGLLPSAMVPSRFVFVDALPLSPSGKIDRKAIRAQAEAGKVTTTSGTVPTNAQSDDMLSVASTVRQSVDIEDSMTDTERRMREIWERTLRISGITRDDHFFTIGGDSLVGVTMALTAEDEFDVSIPIRTLFESPTLSRFSARIDELVAETNEPEHPMQDDANAQFVFPLVEAGRGNPMFFNSVDLKMARRGLWKVDCPLYAISHWAQGTGFVKADSVEELAAVHVGGLKSIQPNGPYRIAGYSFGGLLALEMAQQLQLNGDTVELLFLLDPSETNWVDAVPLNRATAPAPTRRAKVASFASWVKRHLVAVPKSPTGAANYVRRGMRLNRRYLVSHILNLGGRVSAWQWLNYRLVHLHGRHPGVVSTRLLPHDRWPAFWYAAVRLAKSYKARPYSGRTVTVFSGRSEAFNAWAELLGDQHTSYVIDGHHLDMFADSAIAEWTAIVNDAVASLPIR